MYRAEPSRQHTWGWHTEPEWSWGVVKAMGLGVRALACVS